jgi:hypothetical protein
MRAHIMVATVFLNAGILTASCAPHYTVGGENNAPVTGSAAPLAGCAPAGTATGAPIVATANQIGTPFQYSSYSGLPGNAGGGSLASANSPPPPNPNCP